MKNFISAFVIIKLMGSIVGLPSMPLEVPGVRISHRELSFARQAPSCAGQYGGVCSNDCKTLMVCSGSDPPIDSVRCPQFCTNNECSATPTDQCQQLSSFVCTSEGLFPDPSDCTKYHYCSWGGQNVSTYQCPSNYNFNVQTKTCSYLSACLPLNCAGVSNGALIQYNYLNKGYYAMCNNPPILFKCLDTTNYIFNPSSGTCVYNCPYIGSFPDPYNCNNYIICYWGSSGFQTETMTCSPNYYYSGSQCVPGGCTPTRISPSPPPTPVTSTTALLTTVPAQTTAAGQTTVASQTTALSETTLAGQTTAPSETTLVGQTTAASETTTVALTTAPTTVAVKTTIPVQTTAAPGITTTAAP